MVVLDVDRRESPSGIPDLLQSRGARVRLTVLKAGDYAIGRGMGIERKRGDDFARSLIDGRLFEQAGALRRHFARPLFIVEGLVPGCALLNVGWPQIRGALVSLGTAFGLPVLCSSGASETVEILFAASLQAARSFSLGYVRPGYRPQGWRKRALFILQGLPAVGPARAAGLLEAFGSVEAAMLADSAALEKVHGIGIRVARQIRQAVSHPPTPSVSDPATRLRPTSSFGEAERIENRESRINDATEYGRQEPEIRPRR